MDILDYFDPDFLPFLMVFNGLISSPPSEIILFLYGATISYKIQNIIISSIICASLNLFGNLPLYFLGKNISYLYSNSKKDSIPRKFLSIFIKSLKLVNSDYFRNNIYIFILLFRCLPVVRSIISIPVGYARPNFILFLIFSWIGMFLWALFWISCGVNGLKAYLDYGIIGATTFGLILFIFYILLQYISKYLIYKLNLK